MRRARRACKLISSDGSIRISAFACWSSWSTKAASPKSPISAGKASRAACSTAVLLRPSSEFRGLPKPKGRTMISEARPDRLFDCHSHWSTERGYFFRGPDALASQKRIWGTEARFDTEEEMVSVFRRAHARVILDLAITMWMNLDEIREIHDYAFDIQRRNKKAIFGHW